MSVLVRRASEGDAEAVGILSGEFVAYLAALGNPSPRAITAGQYLRDGFGERPAFAGLVAEDAGAVVGYALYHEGFDIDSGGRILILTDLFVSARARGQGVGRALMEATREECRRLEARALVWAVHFRNGAARRFYEDLGATVVDDLVLMSWPA